MKAHQRIIREEKELTDNGGLFGYPIADIKKANPSDQADYDAIKSDIRSKTAAIKGHKSYPELKDGIPWQDGFIKLSDWAVDLKDAVKTLASKANKKGLI